MNPLRKIVQKTGFDFHRHHPSVNRLKYLDSLKIKTVLDIGANVGQFAKEIRQTLTSAHIYSFEPLKECFEKLNVNMNGDRNFTSFNFALGEKEEKVIMNRSSYSPSSSLLPMSDAHKNLFPHTKDHSPENIEVKRLDDVSSKLDLEEKILLKVDVQGFEDKVIAGGQNTFSKAKVVLIETSFTTLYQGQPTFDNIYKQLIGLGFEYRGSLQQKMNKQTGEVISEDSVFVRPGLSE